MKYKNKLFCPRRRLAIKCDGKPWDSSSAYRVYYCGMSSFVLMCTVCGAITLRSICKQLHIIRLQAEFQTAIKTHCRSQRSRGLNRLSVVARLLGLRVRISPTAWISIACECCVLSLRQADHSSRGVPPNVVYLSVIAKPR